MDLQVQPAPHAKLDHTSMEQFVALVLLYQIFAHNAPLARLASSALQDILAQLVQLALLATTLMELSAVLAVQ